MALVTHFTGSLSLNQTRSYKCSKNRSKILKLKHLKPNTRKCNAIYVDDEDDGYLIDAPVSEGDGFSFTGGKYSDEIGPAQIWESKGRYFEAYAVEGGLEKAKEPLFGLQLAGTSQASGELFRWFAYEEGSPSSPKLLLLHGLPSQSYSFRKVISEVSDEFHVLAIDWLGFGLSDKPQPSYGFDYTEEEYVAALGCAFDSLGLEKASIAVQGYFSPAVISWVSQNKEKVDRLILINPPITDDHSKLPSQLAAFTNFLLGEIFAQDPLRASDSLLASCSHYEISEEDSMVYRSPYLNSGAAGFALTAISRQLKKNLKKSLERVRSDLSSNDWKIPTSIIWGVKDKWLSFNGVSEFSKSAGISLTQLSEIGHHAQEDYGEEVGKAIRTILKRTVL